jgi:hypothetical protein
LRPRLSLTTSTRTSLPVRFFPQPPADPPVEKHTHTGRKKRTGEVESEFGGIREVAWRVRSGCAQKEPGRAPSQHGERNFSTGGSRSSHAQRTAPTSPGRCSDGPPDPRPRCSHSPLARLRAGARASWARTRADAAGRDRGRWPSRLGLQGLRRTSGAGAAWPTASELRAVPAATPERGAKVRPKGSLIA